MQNLIYRQEMSPMITMLVNMEFFSFFTVLIFLKISGQGRGRGKAGPTKTNSTKTVILFFTKFELSGIKANFMFYRRFGRVVSGITPPISNRYHWSSFSNKGMYPKLHRRHGANYHFQWR